MSSFVVTLLKFTAELVYVYRALMRWCCVLITLKPCVIATAKICEWWIMKMMSSTAALINDRWGSRTFRPGGLCQLLAVSSMVLGAWKHS